MSNTVAVFTPRPPVNLFEGARLALDTGYRTIVAPPLYATSDDRGQVRELRAAAAVVTRLHLSNTSASVRTVDLRVRSSRRVTYAADVVAQAGLNRVQINGVRTEKASPVFGYDWTDAPPSRFDVAFGGNAAVDWAPDSSRAALGSFGRTYALVDASTLAVTVSAPVTAPARPNTVRWSPDGRYLAIAFTFAAEAGEPALRVLDFDTGSPVEVTLPVAVTGAVVTSVAWGGGRYLVVCASSTPRIQVLDWDSETPVIAAFPALSVSGNPVCARWSPDGRYLAIHHTTGDRLSVFDWATGAPVRVEDARFAANTLALPQGGKGLSWSADSLRLASCASVGDTGFTVFDFTGGTVDVLPPPAPRQFAPGIRTAAWSPDGRYLCVGHDDASPLTYYPTALPYLFLFDYDDPVPVLVSTPRVEAAGRIHEIQWSPDGDLLLVAGSPGDPEYPPTGLDNVRLEDAAGDNRIRNGSFEDTTGMVRTSFGFEAALTASPMPHWSCPPTLQTVRVADARFVDAFATGGRNWLYLRAPEPFLPQPNGDNLRLFQDVAGLTAGETYRLAFDVTGSQDSLMKASVLWNGTAVAIDGATEFLKVEERDILRLTLAPGETLPVDDKLILAYGERLDARASGGGVDAVLAYVLTTQEAVETFVEPTVLPPSED
jgi:WD40 repeat protein